MGRMKYVSKKEIKKLLFRSAKNNILRFIPNNVIINRISWGEIKGWWSKLREYVEEVLKTYLEVVIIDKRHSIGAETLEQLNKMFIDFPDNDADLLVVKINYDGSVAEIDFLEAETTLKDTFDVASAKNNGILRIQ